MKVKMYLIHQYEACAWYECGYGVSLRPYGENTREYKGETLGEYEFELPDGFYVSNDRFGILRIYDANNEQCEIDLKNDEDVYIISSTDYIKIGVV